MKKGTFEVLASLLFVIQFVSTSANCDLLKQDISPVFKFSDRKCFYVPITGKEFQNGAYFSLGFSNNDYLASHMTLNVSRGCYAFDGEIETEQMGSFVLTADRGTEACKQRDTHPQLKWCFCSAPMISCSGHGYPWSHYDWPIVNGKNCTDVLIDVSCHDSYCNIVLMPSW